MIVFRNNSARLRTTAGVRILPGVNLLTPDQVAAIKGHPGGRRKLAGGIFAIDEAEIKTAADMVKAIADMNDVARLRELVNDSRKTVSEAAADRLKVIDSMAEPDGDGDSDS